VLLFVKVEAMATDSKRPQIPEFFRPNAGGLMFHVNVNPIHIHEH
jgi:hypothetical protein